MALQQKHKTVPNQSNRNISLTDTTGIFSVLNPTGYGADQTPTGYRRVTDIQNSDFHILESNGTLKYSGGLTPVIENGLYSVSYNLSNAQSLANGTPKVLDLSTLIGDSFEDGIYKTIYYNWFLPIDVLTTNGENAVILSSAEEAANVKYVRLFGDGNDKIFTVTSIEDSALIVDGDLSEFVNDYQGYLAFESEAYFVNTYELNKCLRSKIAKLSVSNCSCKCNTTNKLYEAVMMYMSIQINMDKGNYTKVQEIINALTMYCNGSNCNGSNCNC